MACGRPLAASRGPVFTKFPSHTTSRSPFCSRGTFFNHFAGSVSWHVDVHRLLRGFPFLRNFLRILRREVRFVVGERFSTTSRDPFHGMWTSTGYSADSRFYEISFAYYVAKSVL